VLLVIACGTERGVMQQPTYYIKLPPTQYVPPKDRLVVVYSTAWNQVMPDPKYLTHINYGFGHVNATFDGIKVDDPVRLRKISLMKTKYPHLKILISIGGWFGSTGFSEMAMSPDTREKFAADCKRVVDAYHLDGVDIDWEYPTILSKYNSASPYDIDNLTLLIRSIRANLGYKKLLTMTSLATARCANFPEIIDYLDYVNVMAYDMGLPPYHHSSLYRSNISGITTVDESIQAHFAAGVPNNKMMLGISFYGMGAGHIATYTTFNDMVKLEGYAIKWDPIGKAPYLVDGNDALVFSYENPASVIAKTKYALEYNLLGVTCWEYGGYWEYRGPYQSNFLVQAIDIILKERDKHKKKRY
jgi:chitinase